MLLPFITANQIRDILRFDTLIPALEKAFTLACTVPERAHYQMGDAWNRDAQMLIMPAWRQDHYAGVKLITLYPDNPKQGRPNITGIYCLFDGTTGQPLAQMDAGEITRWRTAATSVLAAKYLAPADPTSHLIIGTGALARPFIDAYSQAYPRNELWLWGRSADKTQALVADLQKHIPQLHATEDLATAARSARLISTLTNSRTPVLQGDWISPGTYLDLVGSYRPDMREVGDDIIRRAEIFVDIRDGAPVESGDLTQPLDSGLIKMSDIKADLSDLVTGRHKGRSDLQDITLFKSAGAASEDLAAAILIYESFTDL
ncbi:ornithine cyclodeaminase family protein [Paremcibacter congregatus]|uniref:ornithine cyclodeaminase family protein n=1 Tax=Paremcibacter congregatus TaxID=2043170 RepID=UPI003A905B54